MARTNRCCSLKCDRCGGGSSVIDTKTHDLSLSARRRRECTNCGNRWTTYEMRLGTGFDDVRDAIDSMMADARTLARILEHAAGSLDRINRRR